MARLITDDVWATLTIWLEAQDEPFVGMIAVAEVILNRTRARYQSDGTVVGTCLAPLQFSCWNATNPNRVPAAVLEDTNLVVQRCQRAWKIVWENGSHLTSGAVHYHAVTLPPPWPTWATIDHFTVTIGQHRFYTA